MFHNLINPQFYCIFNDYLHIYICTHTDNTLTSPVALLWLSWYISLFQMFSWMWAYYVHTLPQQFLSSQHTTTIKFNIFNHSLDWFLNFFSKSLQILKGSDLLLLFIKIPHRARRVSGIKKDVKWILTFKKYTHFSLWWRRSSARGAVGSGKTQWPVIQYFNERKRTDHILFHSEQSVKST